MGNDTTNRDEAAADTTTHVQTRIVQAIGAPASCSQYTVRTTTRLTTYTCQCGEFFADRASLVAHGKRNNAPRKPVATVEYFDVAHAGPGWYWHSSLTEDAVGAYPSADYARAAARSCGYDVTTKAAA